VIVLHERHLRRLLTGYFQYYHHWRTHRALAMDCPVPRPVQRPEVGPIREVRLFGKFCGNESGGMGKWSP
jgi:hypothetical protein